MTTKKMTIEQRLARHDKLRAKMEAWDAQALMAELNEGTPQAYARVRRKVKRYRALLDEQQALFATGADYVIAKTQAFARAVTKARTPKQHAEVCRRYGVEPPKECKARKEAARD